MIFDAFYISFKVVSISLVLTLFLSLILIYLTVEKNIKFKKFIETLILFPMFLPPSAVGLIILLVLGKNGFIGQYLNKWFDINIIFTISAAVIAAIVVSIPIMYQNIKTSVISIDKELRESAKVMGATDLQIFTKIIIPLSKKGILSGLLLSFARAFGEFGATILVAGNIPQKTQTVPTAIYYAIENNDEQSAKTILMIIVIISILSVYIHNYILKKQI